MPHSVAKALEHAVVEASAPIPSEILDDAPEAVAVIDSSVRIVYVNGACTTLLGRPRGELIGRSAADFLRDYDAAKRPVETSDGRRTVRGVAEVALRDGGSRWISFAARRVRGSDHWVAQLREVPEERPLAVPAASQNELEQTLRAVAHDLRSPLVSVLGFSRLLREEYGDVLAERALHFVNRIDQAGRTMEQLISQLLDYARIGHADERRQRVDPREVLQQLRAELKPRLDEAGVELELPAEPPLLSCDRTRFYQLLSNLVGNALDHMGACDSPRIRVTIDSDGGWAHIRVSDNGKGVDPGMRDCVFDLFRSGPGADGRKRSGLGLSIVRRIAELHGGHAELENSPGAGATFRVSLPSS